MQIGLLITFYKRRDLAAQCLESLHRCDLSKISCIYFHDDGSKDPFLIDLLYDFRRTNHSIKIIIKCNPKNKGIKNALKVGCNHLFYVEGCTDVINLDSDSILKPEAFNRLVDLRERFADRIISGFNCNHPANPIIAQGEDYVERKRANGINMMFSKSQYEKIILKGLNSPNNWDYDSFHDKNFIITKPSVVQHLGADCSTLGHVGGDVACDF